jgi:hypothetical protein
MITSRLSAVSEAHWFHVLRNVPEWHLVEGSFLVSHKSTEVDAPSILIAAEDIDAIPDRLDNIGVGPAIRIIR